MKKNMLMLMMLIAISSYSNINMSKEPHYKVPLTNEFVEAIEQKGYNDFLRIVDEQNRKIGIYSNYTNKANKKANRLHDDVDLVPVAHVVDSSDGNDWKYQLEGLKTPVPDLDASRNFQRTENLITKGAKSIDNESLERMGYQRSGYQNRFYLGNGNTVKDIIYLNKDNFSKEVQKAKDTNNDRFLIEGAYKSIGSRNDEPDTYPNEKETNILGIKVDATKNAKGEYTDEYYAKIQGKSRKEVAAFLKSKMEEKGITGIIQKGDELYTKDSKGNEWKVLWSLEPISLHKSSAPENERFKDTVFTRIYTYNEFDDNSTTDSAGKKLYTKDGSIYLQDKYDYSPELFLKDGWGEPKKLSDKIAEAKENIDNGELPNNTFEHYFYDKKNMTEAAFNAKWVTPFENGDFDRDLENLRKEVKEAKERLAPIEKVYNEAKEKTKAALNDPDWPEGVYWWTLKYMSEADFETFLSTKTEKEKALLKEWKKYSAIEEEKFTEITNLNTDIQENIPKKYGFYKSYWGGSPADEKWLDRVLQDSKIIRNLLGKNIQFRGRGRIEGTIDLGEGSNQIEIEEQFTGRYGTNIILGPYAKILNVKKVWVGGQLGSDSGVSISGRASLSLDIDSTKKNDEGNYYQHALKDSDPNILFMSRFGRLTLDQRNQFQIEMMTSRIGEDGAIDIGRKIDYKYTDIVTGKEYDMTIPFISDSIAHSLVDNKKFSKNGTSLLDVKIKDEIKRLSTEENAVYRSIKNAKKLSVLSETLTTTNKRTTFSVADEDKNEEKLTNLALYLKTKDADELLDDLSQFNLTSTERDEMKKLIICAATALFCAATFVECSKTPVEEREEIQNGTDIIRRNVPPQNSDGKIGDYYINETTAEIYGPKTENGGWGTPWRFGKQDNVGNAKIYSGSGAPSNTDPKYKEGDWYIDVANRKLYGPRTRNLWGNGILIGGAPNEGTNTDPDASLPNYRLDNDGKTLLAWINYKSQIIDMSKTPLNLVEKIEVAAFAGNKAIQKVIFGTQLNTIGASAFKKCYYLEEVVFNENLSQIDETAFENCWYLTTLNLPNRLEVIDQKAFHNCSGLTTVKIPGSCKSIKFAAFEKCKSLTDVQIGEGLENIHQNVFEECTALQSVVLPRSLKALGSAVFKGSGVKKVTFLGAYPETGIAEDAFREATSLSEILVPTEYLDEYINHFSGSDIKNLIKAIH